MRKKKQDNYLDYIPAINTKHSWDVNENGTVTIHIEHKTIYDKIAQKLFKRPPVSNIDLDEIGSFIWKQIDGKKDIGKLGELMKATYGDKAEPLYERLSTYVKILYNNEFITYIKKDV